MRLVTWTPIDVRLEGRSVLSLNEVFFHFESGERIKVPAQFRCDLASVPWLFKRMLPDKTVSAPFALLHDYAYAYAELIEQKLRASGHAGYVLSRSRADDLAEMVAEADPNTDRWSEIYWLGVRIGGQRAWNKHRAARIAEASAVRAG